MVGRRNRGKQACQVICFVINFGGILLQVVVFVNILVGRKNDTSCSCNYFCGKKAR